MRVNGDRTPMNLQFFSEMEPQLEQQQEVSQQQIETTNTDVSGGSAPVVKDNQQDHHAFAEMRTKNKQLSEENEKLKSNTEWWDNWAKENYGNQGINTYEEYKTAYEKSKEQQLQTKAAQGDPEAMKGIISKQVQQEIQRQYEEVKVQNQVQNQLQKEIEELNKSYDLKLKSIDDIEKLDNSEEIIKLVKAGVSIKKAYETANLDSLMNNQVDKVRQATINQASGFNHIKTNGTEPGSIKKVPQDVIDAYKKMVPGISNEEIQKHYRG